MLKSLSTVLTLISVVGYFAYPVVQPYLQQETARVYRVEMSVQSALGSNTVVKANITGIGETTVASVQVQRMESMPPSYSYLRIASDAGTYYAAVFLSSSSAGDQTASFQRLIVPVSNLNSPVLFYYRGFQSNEVSLGAH